MIPHSRPVITDGDVEAVVAALRSEHIAEGKRVAQLEDRFASALAGPRCVATGSGSQALFLALRAAGARPGNRVITPTYVCSEVMGAIRACGAEPVLVDVGKDYLIDVQAALDAVADDTAAIVVPYVLGRWRDISPLRAASCALIEDCAQYIDNLDALKDRLCGDLVTFSFHATKQVAGGEGGLVVARDDRYAEAISNLKHGERGASHVNLFPLSDLQAALVSSQLDRLPAAMSRRRELAERYDRWATSAEGIEPVAPGQHPTFMRWVFRVDAELDALVGAFETAGIAVRRPVDRLLHHMSDAPLGAQPFPIAERLFATTLSLPLYPALTHEQQDQVVEVAHHILSGAG